MGPDHASRTTRTIIDLPCCAEPQVPPLYRRNRWCLWAPGAATESPIIDPGVHAEAAVRYTPTVVTTLLLLVTAVIGAGATLLIPCPPAGGAPEGVLAAEVEAALRESPSAYLSAPLPDVQEPPLPLPGSHSVGDTALSVTVPPANKRPGGLDRAVDLRIPSLRDASLPLILQAGEARRPADPPLCCPS